MMWIASHHCDEGEAEYNGDENYFSTWAGEYLHAIFALSLT
jgi:hypothetical protein